MYVCMYVNKCTLYRFVIIHGFKHPHAGGGGGGNVGEVKETWNLLPANMGDILHIHLPYCMFIYYITCQKY